MFARGFCNELQEPRALFFAAWLKNYQINGSRR